MRIIYSVHFIFIFLQYVRQIIFFHVIHKLLFDLDAFLLFQSSLFFFFLFDFISPQSELFLHIIGVCESSE